MWLTGRDMAEAQAGRRSARLPAGRPGRQNAVQDLLEQPVPAHLCATVNQVSCMRTVTMYRLINPIGQPS